MLVSKMRKFAFPDAKLPTPNLKFALALTPNPDASQWNIGGLGLLALAMYISCTFHVYFTLFVQLFPRWQRENQPTQRQIPVEYRL